MSTLKVNTIQSNTTSELDINSPLGTIPSLDVIGSATIGGNLNAVGVITATSIVATTGTFSGNVSIGGTLTYEDVTNIDSVGIITARSGVRVNSGGLVVTSGVSTFTNLVVSAGSTSAPSISPTGDSNTGIFFPSPDTITFTEGGVEALRITSSGDIGIATTNPQGSLEVVNTVVGTGVTTVLRVRQSSSNTETNFGAKLELYGTRSDGQIGRYGAILGARQNRAANNDGYLAFFTGNGDASQNEVERVRVTSTGNVEITNGNLVFSTAGKGIDFSATANSSGTMTSELLDDYETGTWTPAWASTGTLPTLSYSTQSGYYVKIGRVVHFWGRIYMNSWGGGGGSGNIRVTGLPFTSNSDSNHGGPLCQVTFTYSSGTNSTWPSGVTQVFARVLNNSTTLEYIGLGAPTTLNLGENAPIQWTTNPQMYNNYFSGSYFV